MDRPCSCPQIAGTIKPEELAPWTGLPLKMPVLTAGLNGLDTAYYVDKGSETGSEPDIEPLREDVA